jgi:D-alanyl-D-alanine carboxypeptidase/D-alanyl-D-alanine-endopeptidase (penicillin-binding protein 4)
VAFILFSLGVVGSAFGNEDKKNPDIFKFNKKIKKILNHSCLKKGNFGVKFYSLDRREVLFQHKQSDLFIPASNVKLITTAVALKELGPDYRFKTELYSLENIQDGVLKGDLYIKGFGDPKLVTEQLWLLASDLKNFPVTEIQGSLIADESYFDLERRIKTWKKSFGSEPYNAPLGALSFNFNTVKLLASAGKKAGDKVDVILEPDSDYTKLINRSVTRRRGRKYRLIVDRTGKKGVDQIKVAGGLRKGTKLAKYYLNISYPAIYTAKTFKSFLSKVGVTLRGKTKIGVVPDKAKLIVKHRSEPLSVIIRGLNKFSNNFVAEQLVKSIGAANEGVPGTTKKGLKAINLYLKNLGFEEGSYHLDDGSGLSRTDRLTPDILIATLENVYDNWETYPEFISSLAVMGQEGSVKKRYFNHPRKGTVRVKTGTLDSVSALSGYFQTLDGERMAFSIIMNDLKCQAWSAQKVQDKLVKAGLNFKRTY